MWKAKVPYVLSVRPSRGSWGLAEAPHTPPEAAEQLAWRSPEEPGDWTAVERRFRDGHTETWWAVDLRLPGYGPDQTTRLLAATTDPARLPAVSTWYVVTNLPLPGTRCTEEEPAFASADLAEIVRLYGLRQWVEQSYKQVKGALGFSDFQVLAPTVPSVATGSWCFAPFLSAGGLTSCASAAHGGGFGSRGGKRRRGRTERSSDVVMAGGAAAGAKLVGPVGNALALLESVVECAPATSTASPA